MGKGYRKELYQQVWQLRNCLAKIVDKPLWVKQSDTCESPRCTHSTEGKE